ncbi:DUF3077 domain-containing protein [Pseudomonas rubra]|uniref:DUF3077 domain-containing protein n=1 Tax=Pseudomonas rubra TaxID=2942627 RepID=A0ABT5P9H3_9PSED|nr:DUF3077 domain-containing protein [Pseudomonas rubra]MDD1014955.1 DUF3077 domain-containing protein [Pseudomonas rubra]MDD1038076.1 DUF3077 domain-containing protein [Pseudomonas rubra]MDD1156589.1 DUF3077 domain-containing protein [Pseudomonas rubra]
MSENSIEGRTSGLQTTGVGVFGEGQSGMSTERLFRVEPGHSADFVLEQAAVLIGCVGKLTHLAMLEGDETMVCAAHYLSGMAKALVEDVTHAIAESNR